MAHIVEVVQATAVFAPVLKSSVCMSPNLGCGVCTMTGSATVGAKCSIGLRDGLALFVDLAPESIIRAAGSCL